MELVYQHLPWVEGSWRKLRKTWVKIRGLLADIWTSMCLIRNRCANLIAPFCHSISRRR